MSRYNSLPWLESSSLPRGYTDSNSFYGSSRPTAPLANLTTPRSAFSLRSVNQNINNFRDIRSSINNPFRDIRSVNNNINSTQTFSIIHQPGFYNRNMANWNMVWLQPKTGQTSFDFSQSGRVRQSTDAASEAEPMSPEEEKRIEQLCRPTVSSSMKRETPWMKRYHVLSFMDGDRVSWSKQELRKDCESNLWNDLGTCRTNTKI